MLTHNASMVWTLECRKILETMCETLELNDIKEYDELKAWMNNIYISCDRELGCCM